MSVPRNIVPPPLEKSLAEARKLQKQCEFEASNNILKDICRHQGSNKNEKFWGDVAAAFGENYFAIGNYTLALPQFLEAERIFKQLQLAEELAQAAGNVGVAYRKLGLLGHSLLKYLESLTYALELPDTLTLASSLMHAAAVLFDIGKTDKAFKALDTTLLCCDKKPDDLHFDELRVVALNNKATFYIHLQQFEKAVQLLEEAKTVVREKCPRSRHSSMVYSNITLCLMRLKRFDEAYELLKKQIQKRKNLHDDQQIADMVKLALIYREHFKNNAEFLKLTKVALKAAVDRKLLARQLYIYRLLKDYYTKENKPAELRPVETSLQKLEEQDQLNRQTAGMENLLDAKLFAIEKKLLAAEGMPSYLNRFDYLTGSFSYNIKGVTAYVPLRDIGFCEVKGNYMFVQTFARNKEGLVVRGECYKVRKTMKEFVDDIETSKQYFSRVHNSFIVNLFYAGPDSMKANLLNIGDNQIKVSDTYRKPFKQDLNSFLRQKATL